MSKFLPQVRMYPEPPQHPQQIQYLTTTPPSTTPSPGQPQSHQQVCTFDKSFLFIFTFVKI